MYNHYQRVFVLHLPGSCSLLLMVLLLLLLVVMLLDEAAEMKVKKYLRLKYPVYKTIIREFSVLHFPGSCGLLLMVPLLLLVTFSDKATEVKIKKMFQSMSEVAIYISIIREFFLHLPGSCFPVIT